MIFGHHRHMLDALEATAVRCNVGYIRIDGSVPSTERLSRVDAFQSDDSVCVAVLGLLAAGVGLTLTAASAVVFAELHWTPGVLVQAEDRAHRIGQKSSVNVHYLVGDGTLDDLIWPSVSHKVEVVSAMCDGRRSHLDAKLAKLAVPAERSRADAGSDVLGDEDAVPMDLDELVASELAQRGELRDALPPGVPDAPTDDAARTPKPSAYSVLSMLQGRGPKRGAGRPWVCPQCTLRNNGEARSCAGCGSERKVWATAELPKRHCGNGGLGASDTPEVIDDEEDSIEIAPVTECKGAARLAFHEARFTGRIHLLHHDGTPVGVNFKPSDWEAMRQRGVFEGMLSDGTAQQEVEQFVREWSGLRPTDRRHLVDQVLRLPIANHLVERSMAARSTLS